MSLSKLKQALTERNDEQLLINFAYRIGHSDRCNICSGETISYTQKIIDRVQSSPDRHPLLLPIVQKLEEMDPTEKESPKELRNKMNGMLKPFYNKINATLTEYTAGTVIIEPHRYSDKTSDKPASSPYAVSRNVVTLSTGESFPVKSFKPDLPPVADPFPGDTVAFRIIFGMIAATAAFGLYKYINDPQANNPPAPQKADYHEAPCLKNKRSASSARP